MNTTLPSTTMKVCRKCGNSLPLASFCHDKHRADGLSGVCRACRAENMRKWRAANAEHYREYHKKYQRERKAAAAAKEITP